MKKKKKQTIDVCKVISLSKEHTLLNELYKLKFVVHDVQLNYISSSQQCSPVAQETEVQSKVESYQRLKKWYLIPPCLTRSIRRYVSRVK